MWTDSTEGGSPPREVAMSPVTPASATVANAAAALHRSGDIGSPLWRSSPHKNVVPGVVTATRAPPRAQASTTSATASPLPERKGLSASSGANASAATAAAAASNSATAVRSSGANAAAVPATPPARFDKEANKRKQLQAILEQPLADLAQLRKLCWSGIASDLRPHIWRLLLGCVPTQLERRAATVARKRSEYQQLLPEYEKSDRSEYEAEQLKQIEKDVPRPHLQAPLLCEAVVQRSLSRTLYLWALRHPVVGYVQGFNDLVSLFLCLSFSEALGPGWASAQPPSQAQLVEMEADAFWSLAKLIDGMQDVYTNDRRGLFRMMSTISTVVARVDPALSKHFENEGINYDLFVVPWINCLLLRSFPLELVWRLYDTYFAEGDIAKFHPYVCVAFLTSFADKLKQMSFQEALMFLQNPPTASWGTDQLEVLLSRAFLLQETYHETVHAKEGK